jgi:very-short-patch-repair endonuclease
VGDGNPVFGKNMSIETRKLHSKIQTEVWTRKGHYEKVKNGIERYVKENGYYPGTDDGSMSKKKETCLIRYGVDNISKLKESRIKAEKTCIDKYGKHSWEIALDKLNKVKITSIEQKTKDILDKHKIKYKRNFKLSYIDENKFCYKVYDFYIIDHNVLIEVDGDYWHANPIYFNKLNETQQKNVDNDKFKNQLALDNGFKLLRYFETIINEDKFEGVLIEDING